MRVGLRHEGGGLGLCLVLALAAGASRGGVAGSGSLIAFQSYRGGNYEIVAMQPDGSGQSNLTRNPACDALPAWSPDARRIAFERTTGRLLARNTDVWVMNADGSGQRDLTPRNRWFDGD